MLEINVKGMIKAEEGNREWLGDEEGMALWDQVIRIGPAKDVTFK